MKKDSRHYSSFWDLLAKKWWIIIAIIGMIAWILASVR